MYLEFQPVLLLLSLSYISQCFAAGCSKVDARTIKCNYIPQRIDNGISRVYILNVERKRNVITGANFSSPNWGKVDYLEFGEQENSLHAHFVFQNGCFANLVSLKELRIHISHTDIFPDTFVGLDSVSTLDIKDCSRLTYHEFVQALNGTNKLPRLEKLVLPQQSVATGAYALNDSFIEILLPRNITYIDISSAQISMLNITAVAKKLKHLVGFNMSYTDLDALFSHDLTQNDLKRIQIFDLSYATLPMKIIHIIPGVFVLDDVHVKYSELHPNSALILSPQTFNASGIIPTYSSILMKNCTAVLDKDLQWQTENFVLQENNLKYLDIKIICNKFNMSSFRQVDLSANQMEFLHPSVLQCMPNLRAVDLSENNLYKMAEYNSSLFEKLFFELPNLTYIGLAGNSLTEIPVRLFSHSRIAKTIDLSRNHLQQITFTLTENYHLQMLDLSYNNIQILDSSSLNHLDSIPHLTDHVTRVVFTANPMLCSKCKSKQFLKWLKSTNLTDMTSQNLKCINEDGNSESINDSTLRKVAKICTRNILTVTGCVTAGVMFIVILMLAGIMYARKRRQQKMQNRVNVINRLREGEGQHEFVAYLAYSSDDQDFVAKYVLDQLRENLQLMTGIDRELICTGDKHLRFGFDIQSETIRCLDRSSVVIVVVSRSFCISEYCHNELDQAYIKQKPIVLMFMERVEEDIMMPTMKELYRNNVRMLWTFENGEYFLKSTWDNVCTSVLDLVQCDV